MMSFFAVHEHSVACLPLLNLNCALYGGFSCLKIKHQHLASFGDDFCVCQTLTDQLQSMLGAPKRQRPNLSVTTGHSEPLAPAH